MMDTLFGTDAWIALVEYVGLCLVVGVGGMIVERREDRRKEPRR